MDEKNTIQQNASYWDGQYDMAKHILLLLFTFGIWYFIWIYRMTGFLNQGNESDRTPTNQLLLCLFVPFYSIYWMYESAKRVDHLAANHGVKSDIATICLILSIFIIIIPPIIIQDKVNTIISGNADTTQTQNNSSLQFDTTEELIKFKKLLDSGIITQEEFEDKKRQLLDTYQPGNISHKHSDMDDITAELPDL